LLRGRFPPLDRAVDRTLEDVLQNWARPNGAFRSRKLLLGWDNVPMHRWGQSEMFRSLALWLVREHEPQPPAYATGMAGGFDTGLVCNQTKPHLP